MHKVTGRAGGAPDLPISVLTEILQHVPQQQRLAQYALVCQAWAPAAAQATRHVWRKLRSCKLPALQSWMAGHAGQLQTLKLSVSCQCQPCLQLPLQQLTQLRHLQLDGITLQLLGSEGSPSADIKSSSNEGGSSKSHSKSNSKGSSKGNSSEGNSSKARRPGTLPLPLPLPRGKGKVRGKKHSSSSSSSSEDSILAASPVLSSLRHLELASVKLADISSLLQLTKAPQLTCLMLEDITLVDIIFISDPEHTNPSRAVSRVARVISGLLQQLPLLSVLEIPGFPFTDAAVQQAAALTRLRQLSIMQRQDKAPCKLDNLPRSITELLVEGNAPDSGPSIPLRWPQLSGLLQLELNACAVYPEVLHDLSQLQKLHLDGCRLLPHDPEATYNTEGTAALLEALPRLTCLEDLLLEIIGLDIDIAPQQFSVLAASSQLTVLHLLADDTMPIPKGALQHMFPPGRQMQIQDLSIAAYLDNDRYFSVNGWCLDNADLVRISEACPQLQSLDITHTVQPSADLALLLQLPASCTSLEIGGAAFTDSAVPILLQLTQLQNLDWAQSRWFTDNGLEQLTRLDLDELTVEYCGLSDVVCPGDKPLQLKSDPVLGSVKQQLDELCDRSLVCAPIRVRKLRERLRDAEQQAKAATDREQELQERLQSSAAEIQQLRQQLEAAQAARRQE